VKIAVLASGSAGNALLVSSDTTRVLVDAGLSARRTLSCLEGIDVDPCSVDAVLITHEHRDHVGGLGPLVRKLDLPIYGTAGTLGAVRELLGPGAVGTPVEAGRSFRIGSLSVSPFSVSHDCVDPVCYSIGSRTHRAVIATDLGALGKVARYHLSRADCVVLEFNHDEGMLIDGSYPWSLKRRIMSRVGHLSNEVAAREVERLAGGRMSLLVLAHLSRENNTQELAMSAASSALGRAERDDVRVAVSHQDRPIGPFEIPPAPGASSDRLNLKGAEA
jgi:phosphoribosyl 1,2-cyclic phosphodiesterase